MYTRKAMSSILVVVMVACWIGAAQSGWTEGENAGTVPVAGQRASVPGAIEVLPAPRAARVSIGPAATMMSEGFEGAWPGAGWEVADYGLDDGGEFLWGKRDCHPRTGSYGGWAVGGGAGGSALACAEDYPNDAHSWAVYGPIDLSGADSASLSFYFWGRTELGAGCPYDYLFVGSSADGTNYGGTRYCGDWREGDAGNGYYQRTLDLSDRLGQSQVWVTFVFRSDSSANYEGITVDDLTLSATGDVSTPTPTPTGTASTPTPTPVLVPAVYAPAVAKGWSAPKATSTPTLPASTPPAPACGGNIPCLLLLAQVLGGAAEFEIQVGCETGSYQCTTDWAYDPGTGAVIGFDLTCRNAGDVVFYEAACNIQRDGYGRIGSYDCRVSGDDFQAYDEAVVNGYDVYGKVVGADVTKTYLGSGHPYTMDLVPCWLGETWGGYQVTVQGGSCNGDAFTIGNCP